MRERVSELSTLMNRPWCFGGSMAGDSARERKLSEELADAVSTAIDVGIRFAVRAIEIGAGHYGGTTVPRARNENGVGVAFPDNAIQVSPHEVEAGRCAPVP